MDKISPLARRNPAGLLRGLGERLRAQRLARGWTQEELAERAGVAPSTLKLLEARGHGSLQRLARVAVALGIEEEMRGWFAQALAHESIEAVKRTGRQRAPRRTKMSPSPSRTPEPKPSAPSRISPKAQTPGKENSDGTER